MQILNNKIIIVFLLFLFILLSIEEIQAENSSNGDLWTLFNYLRIQKALINYRGIMRHGGWPTLPYNIILKKGDTAEEVLILKKRLFISGDLPTINEKKLFDDRLEKSLKEFQYRHGLIEDGILGPETIFALNVPVSERIKQLERNRENIYKLFRKYIDRYILVNIPAYELRVIEDGEEVLKMKAIVGKKERKTPIFSDQIEYIVLNPTWRIPIKKVVKDIIPIIKENPDYLKYKNIHVFDSWGEDARELIPDDINWDKYNLDNFNLMLEQESGPGNELGQVKFMFPNDYLVYIHDTPDRELFDYKNRAFSSGCIRVEKPFELALYCLKDVDGWNWEEIMGVIETGEQKQINLAETIPVIIVYWTAWVDENNRVHFRKDIYNHYK